MKNMFATVEQNYAIVSNDRLELVTHPTPLESNERWISKGYSRSRDVIRRVTETWLNRGVRLQWV